MIDWKPFNAEVVAEFRANGGKVAQFGDKPVVILHTIGARTGEVRLIPLVVVPDGNEMLLYATAAGASAHPHWYFNLRANPQIAVELGSERFTAEVLELAEPEARKKVQQMSREVPQFAAYVESALPRAIPVFSITRA